MRPGFRRTALGHVALLTVACANPPTTHLSRAVTDSLPGGIPRVMSPGPTAWTDSAGAALVEQNRFSGEDGTDAELGQPRSMAVDDVGRIYIVDSKPAAIKVFTPDGQLVRIIGREGEGPGEFRVGFIAVRGTHLVLHDPSVARTSVWDTSGTFQRSWHSSCCYWTDIQVDRAGRIYVPSTAPTPAGEPDRGNAWGRWTTDGTAIDTLWVPRGAAEKFWTVTVRQGDKVVSQMNTSIPFRPALVSALDPEGGFVIGWTGDYAITRSRGGRDTLRVFGRAWTPDPITEARRRGELESRIKSAGDNWGEANVRAAFRLEDIPATLPAYLSLRVDGTGRVWARRYAVADTSQSFFDVFDSAGAYLGPITLPFKINEWGMQSWTKDGLVTVIEDEEGRPTVVRFKLEPSGKTP